MRYWYDTEFLEDGRLIDLISIGIVCEDGREYYAVAADAPWSRIGHHAWLCEHVVPFLPLETHPRPAAMGDGMHFIVDRRSDAVKPERQIAQEVAQFLSAPEGDRVELWTYYGAYDHVVLNQLWGPMIQHPEHLPMYSNDLMQEVRRLGVDTAHLPRQAAGRHHALADARHNRVMWEWLRDYRPEDWSA